MTHTYELDNSQLPRKCAVFTRVLVLSEYSQHHTVKPQLAMVIAYNLYTPIMLDVPVNIFTQHEKELQCLTGDM